MKIKSINTKKIKNIMGCVLVGTLLASTGLADSFPYTIEKGDTLTGISQKFYGTIEYSDEIAFLNNIPNENFIRAGDVLYLPDDVRNFDFCGQDNYYYGEPDVLYYEFQKGDTLWRLASENYGSGIYWKPLAAYNGITDPKRVVDGTIIKIPAMYKLDLSLVNSDYGNTSNNYVSSTRTYVFQEGDTLWRIASENYGSGNYWNELAVYNNISNPKRISNGTVISLPDKSILELIREGNYPLDLYTISKNTYGSGKYASLIAALNGVTNIGNFNIHDLYLPSYSDLMVYYESDTYEYNNTGYYTIRIGDTLKTISELVYDDPNYGDYIRDVNGIDRLVPGTIIFIPEVNNTYTK